MAINFPRSLGYSQRFALVAGVIALGLLSTPVSHAQSGSSTLLPSGSAGATPSAAAPVFVMPRRMTIANLVPEDREAVRAFLRLVTDFRDEIRARRERYEARLTDYDGLAALLQRGFDREAADRRFRQVVMDMSSDDFRYSIIGDKLLESFWVPPGDTPPRPCKGTMSKDADGFRRCYERDQDLWRRDLIPVIEDWFAQETYLLTHDDSDPATRDVFGTLPNRMRALGLFYERHEFLTQDIIETFGPYEDYEGSIFLTGYVDEPDERYTRDAKDWPLAASQDADGYWLLSAGMRDLLVALTDYVTEARTRWEQYEEILSAEYPRFVARVLGRLAGIKQEYGRLQNPVIDALREAHQSITRKQLQNRFGTTASWKVDKPLTEEWLAGHLGLVRPLDEPLACWRSLDGSVSRLDWGVSVLQASVFANPAFLGAEMIEGVEPGQEIDWARSSHVKGDLDGKGVAEPPTSLARLGSIGGIVLRRCEMRLLEPGQVPPPEVPVAKPDVTPPLRFVAWTSRNDRETDYLDDRFRVIDEEDDSYAEPARRILGHPYYIEAAFDERPKLDEYTGTVGGLPVTFRRTDRPTVYRSTRLFLVTDRGIE